MFIRFTPKLTLVFAFNPQYVYQISATLKQAYASYSDFCKLCKKKKNKKNKMKNFFLKV